MKLAMRNDEVCFTNQTFPQCLLRTVKSLGKKNEVGCSQHWLLLRNRVITETYL